MFKAGDAVELTTGGPAMTIEEIIDGNIAWCNWFDGLNQRQTGRFPLSSLKRVTKKSEKSPQRSRRIGF